MKWPWAQTKQRSVEAEDFFGRPLPSDYSRVSRHDALGFAPVYSAVRLLSETISTLPVGVVARDGDIRKRIDHPAADRLREPNDCMTGQTLIECMVAHLETYGEAYLEKSGANLWPVDASRVTPERRGTAMVFKVSTRDGVIEVGADRLAFFKNAVTGSDGIRGVSPISLLSKDLGAALAARDHARKFFTNAATPAGILKHPAVLSDGARQRVKKDFDSAHAGAENAGRTILLEEGLEWATLASDPERSQLLLTRQFSVSDIARIWRIPPHMIADLSRSTFSNAESEMQSFATHSLRPRLVRLEQQLDLALLSPAERRAGLGFSFNLDGLLRGSLLDRYKSYQIAITSGFMNRNEARQLENREAVDGLSEFVLGAPGTALVGDNNSGGDPGAEKMQHGNT